MQSITPCLWFDDNTEEAVKFYTSIFKSSEIKTVTRYGEAAAKASGRPQGVGPDHCLRARRAGLPR